MQEHHEEDQEVYQNHQMQEPDEDLVDDEEIVPSSHPPQVPEDGTYIDALNEAGVDQARIDQL